ncbi:hypothetical protein ACFU99_07670 [Streptomyces sp. NPDC057654]|uniref:hypothetical protein n=1 Tax=Streptomyces sp. NPDC057654 TaxID=3346196 RepID=UPI0036777098
MLTCRVPEDRVRQRTKLSSFHVRRLAHLVAEEARAPRPPRNVYRTPARPARCQTPHPGPAPQSEQLTLQFD